MALVQILSLMNVAQRGVIKNLVGDETAIQNEIFGDICQPFIAIFHTFHPSMSSQEERKFRIDDG